MPTDVFFGYLLIAVCVMGVWFVILYNLPERSIALTMAVAFFGLPLLTLAAVVLTNNFVIFLEVLVAGGIILKFRSITRHKVAAERGEPLERHTEKTSRVPRRIGGLDEVIDAAPQAILNARRGQENKTLRKADTSAQRTDAVKPERGEDVRAAIAVARGIAASGGSARVTLPDGRIVEVMIPCFGAKDALQLRLRGLGLPGLNSGEAGDALITVTIAQIAEASSAKARYDDLPADDPEVAQQLKLAADLGNATAEYHLGRILLRRPRRPSAE